jgi:hypothetical protein
MFLSCFSSPFRADVRREVLRHTHRALKNAVHVRKPLSMHTSISKTYERLHVLASFAPDSKAWRSQETGGDKPDTAPRFPVLAPQGTERRARGCVDTAARSLVDSDMALGSEDMEQRRA